MFSRSFHQYSWKSEVETKWKSLICWRHRTSIVYHLLCSPIIHNFRPLKYGFCKKSLLYEWTSDQLNTSSEIHTLVPLTNIAHSFDNLLRDTWHKEKVDIYSWSCPRILTVILARDEFTWKTVSKNIITKLDFINSY